MSIYPFVKSYYCYFYYIIIINIIIIIFIINIIIINIVIFIYSWYIVVKSLIKTNYPVKARQEFHTKQIIVQY